MIDTVAASLEPFVCSHCGSPIPAVDAPTATCPACAAVQPVPAAHREAVRLLADSDAARRRAAAALARYEARTVPWSLVVVVALLPGAITAVGVVAATLFEFAGVGGGVNVPVFLGEWVWIPLALAAWLTTLVFWYSSYLSGWVPGAKAALAARPPAAAGAPPGCRMCGAPLMVLPGHTFARCIYCGADSLVVVDAIEARRLAQSVQDADADAERALAHFRDRGDTARRSSLVMLAVWVGLAALPCLWSFGGKPFRTSGWATAAGVTATPLVIFSIAMSMGTLDSGAPARKRSPATAGTKSHGYTGLGLLASLVVLVLFFAIEYAEAP